MIKDTFVLNKNSWHMKLMDYIWNLQPGDFSHLCPYFWLTIFNVVALPVILLLKMVAWIIYYIGDVQQRAIERWEARYYLKLKNDPKEYKRFMELNLFKSRYKKYSNFMDTYMNGDKDREWWITFYKDRSKYRSNKDQEASRKYHLEILRSVNNKARINKILRIVKPVIQILLIILAVATVLLLAYWLYLYIHYLATVPHKTWVSILYGTLKVLAAVACGILMWSISKIKTINPAIISTGRILLIPFTLLWLGVKYIGSKIGLAAQFIYLMIKESCPAIKWID